MQIKKDKVRNDILIAAKDDFMNNGFLGASIRRIAKKANVAQSNIYNYFKNKDEIFKAIVLSTLESLEKFSLQEQELNNIPVDEYLDMFNIEETVKEFKAHINMVYDNYDNFKLLFLHAHGSNYEKFKEVVIDNITMQNMAFLKAFSYEKKVLDKDLSMLVHNSAAFYVNFFIELIMHEVDREKAMEKIEGLATFIYYGWKGILE